MRRAHSTRTGRWVAALALAAIVAACGGGTGSPPASSALPAPPATAASQGSGASGSPQTSPTLAATRGPSASPSASPASSLAYPMPSVTVSLRRVVGGLPQPIGAVSPGDGRLFVVGQKGQIVIVSGGAVSGTFLDISSRISCCGERGLLGLAFHPQYASNGRFFVRYTDPTGDVRISEFHRSASNPDLADPASERVLLTVPHRTYGNHNGGTIAFGPGGFLYIGTGDGGGGGDPFGNGQKLSVLLGKLLRIDVDHAAGGLAYGIPRDNPFAATGGDRPEIWAYGLRNPYSFSFDRQTGDLWIGDVGQDAWEEVDRATVAGGLGRGADYGWSVMEGDHCYSPSSGCDTTGKTLPIAEYDHAADTGSSCAIVGGFVYRGSRRPDLVGRYFFADYCSGRIWDLDAAGPAAQSPQLLASSGPSITGWGEGGDGELYLTSADGSLYELQ